MNIKGQHIKTFQDVLGINIISCCRPIALVQSLFILATNQSPTIKTIAFLNSYKHLFVRELPAVWDISFTTNMGFIAIQKRNKSFLGEQFEFFQNFKFVVIYRFIRLAFYSFSDAFISSAKTFKKLRKVSIPTGVEASSRCDSHSALACDILWRFNFIEAKIASWSSTFRMIDLRPRPDFVNKPSIPSALYRFSQLFTLTFDIPTILPTSIECRPSDFSRTVWQRLRKAWLLLVFSPFSNSIRADAVSFGVFTRPMGQKYKII